MFDKILCVTFVFSLMYSGRQYVTDEDLADVARECNVTFKFAVAILENGGVIKPWRNGIWKVSSTS